LGRIELFRKEARELGVLPAETNGPTSAATDSPSKTDRPVHFLFLGSSLGNFDRQSAGPFLASLPLRPGTSDSLLLGLDGRPSSSDKETAIDGHLPSQMRYEEGKRKVEVAYDDPKGKTRDFILHGIDVAAEALEMEDAVEDDVGSVPKRRTSSLRRDSWSYKSRYNVKMGRHEAYYGSNEDQEVTWTEKSGRRESVTVAKGELLNIEWSLKVSGLASSIDKVCLSHSIYTLAVLIDRVPRIVRVRWPGSCPILARSQQQLPVVATPKASFLLSKQDNRSS